MYNPDTRKFENLMGSASVAAATGDARKFENLMGSSIAIAAAAAAAANSFSVAQSQIGPSEWYCHQDLFGFDLATDSLNLTKASYLWNNLKRILGSGNIHDDEQHDADVVAVHDDDDEYLMIEGDRII